MLDGVRELNSNVQSLADHIDQLDLALDQLAIKDRNFDRFALMLIDNIAELALHEYAADKASENESCGRRDSPKYDPKAVAAALGQHFDAKVKFARNTEFISSEFAESFLYVHMFRNTAYHRGVRHEGILHAISLLYFRSICSVLEARSEQAGWSWSSRDQVSHRAMKYLGLIQYGQFGKDWSKSFVFAFRRLRDVAESMGDTLVDDLSLDMRRAIDHADGALDFLEKNSPRRGGETITRDTLIVDAQVWHIFHTEEAQLFAIHNGCKDFVIAPYVEWLKVNYPWPTRSDPVPSWRKRLDSLQAEKNPHVALKKYCDFMSQTEDLRERINASAGALDQHLDELAGR